MEPTVFLVMQYDNDIKLILCNAHTAMDNIIEPN